MKNRLKLTVGIFLLCFVLLAVSPAVPSEFYRWKDKDGKVHYSDTPPPPGMEAEIRKFKEEPAAKEKSGPKVSIPQPKSETIREKRSYSSINVIMYMTSW
jgi:hypothetical protein